MLSVCCKLFLNITSSEGVLILLFVVINFGIMPAPVRRAKTTKRAEPYTAAKKAPFAMNKKFGQHLLRNPGILDKIIAAAEIKKSDTVLEIGPGTGNLTLKLLPICNRVRALDIDERMVAEVKKRAFSSGHSNLDVALGNALKMDLGPFDVCAANLPYQISSAFVFKLVAHRPLFRSAVLMFQLEFAERMMAKAGDKDYCRLSLNTQLFFRVDRVCKVDRNSFNPPPKVDSMVVRLRPRKDLPKVDFREWDGLVRILFTRKNKTMAASFKPHLSVLLKNARLLASLRGEEFALPSEAAMKAVIQEVIVECGLENQRARHMDSDAVLGLLVACNRRGIHFNNKLQTRVQSDDPLSGLTEEDFLSLAEETTIDE